MRTYLRISGTIFAVVSIVHLVRLMQEWPVQVQGWDIPLWLSGVAMVVTAALSVWAFRLAGSPAADRADGH